MQPATDEALSLVMPRDFQLSSIVLVLLTSELPDHGERPLPLSLILSIAIVWCLFASRKILWSNVGRRLKHPVRVLVVGTGGMAADLAREVLGRPNLNIELVGFLDEPNTRNGKALINPPVLGTVEEVAAIVKRERIQRVVISLSEQRGVVPAPDLLRLRCMGVLVEDIHGFYERVSGRIPIDDIRLSDLVFSDGFLNSPLFRAIKRATDVCVSFLVLVVTAPITGCAALALWLETGRPIFVHLKRVGLAGKQFDMLRFRSTRDASESGGSCSLAGGNDSLSHVGRLIRKCDIEGLPQFLNVVRGEMSLVGPRPKQPRACALGQREAPLFPKRHAVRPGLTGWAKVQRTDCPAAERAKRELEYDFFYLKHRSLAMDVEILRKAAVASLASRRASRSQPLGGGDMKVAILAGGVGTRLVEETDVKPKPMVAIGGRPILWHIMMHYAAYGHRDFVIALGYKGEIIKRYMVDYCSLNGDLTVDLGKGLVTNRPNGASGHDWVIQLVETGQDTQTGGRIKRLGPYVGNHTFFLTWGDGVSDVDLNKLLEFHRSHGKLVTVTAVRPTARFGRLDLDGDRVARFSEKPQIAEGWINGAFFVVEPGALDYIDGDMSAWEREPLEKLAADGQLMAYRHTSFWQCMDTLRDKKLLDSLWESGKAPWKIGE